MSRTSDDSGLNAQDLFDIACTTLLCYIIYISIKVIRTRASDSVFTGQTIQRGVEWILSDYAETFSGETSFKKCAGVLALVAAIRNIATTAKLTPAQAAAAKAKVEAKYEKMWKDLVVMILHPKVIPVKILEAIETYSTTITRRQRSLFTTCVILFCVGGLVIYRAMGWGTWKQEYYDDLYKGNANQERTEEGQPEEEAQPEQQPEAQQPEAQQPEAQPEAEPQEQPQKISPEHTSNLEDLSITDFQEIMLKEAIAAESGTQPEEKVLPEIPKLLALSDIGQDDIVIAFMGDYYTRAAFIESLIPGWRATFNERRVRRRPNWADPEPFPDVAIISFTHNEQNISLVDLPPFAAGTNDAQILRNTAEFLDTSYRKKIMISGIIYLHDISDYGETPKSITKYIDQNLEFFKRLLYGRTDLSFVALTTTGWKSPTVCDSLEQTRKAVTKELNLISPEIWGDLLARGARNFHHAGDENLADRGSTLEIIDYLVRDQKEKPWLKKEPFQIQDEMKQGVDLAETEVGRYVQVKIKTAMTELQQRLKDARQTLEDRKKDETETLGNTSEEHKASLGDSSKDDEKSPEYRREKLESDISMMQLKFQGLEKEDKGLPILNCNSNTWADDKEDSNLGEDVPNELPESAQKKSSKWFFW